MGRKPSAIDVVVVAYNSADTLRDCVAPLVECPGVSVIVVDNDSPDDSLAAVADLPIRGVHAGYNGGFAAGCNIGIAHGTAPYVLLLNPDARISPEDLAALAAVLDDNAGIGIVAPRIMEADGSLAFSQRRFPRRRSTFAQALFLHRLMPQAPWTDELIRDPAAYEATASPEWVSGACLLARRTALVQIGGLDEDFFLYCEDADLCARVRAAGWDVTYTPVATVHHEGGRSGSRDELLPLLARNRVLYARKHGGIVAAAVEAIGVALGHATHAIAALRRPQARRGHLRALASAFTPTGAGR